MLTFVSQLKCQSFIQGRTQDNRICRRTLLARTLISADERLISTPWAILRRLSVCSQAAA